MPRRRAHAPLNVFLNSRLVGELVRAPSGAIAFSYDASWLSWDHTFPISLSMPLREDRYIGDPVIAVFDNLLPDNREIRRRVAARTGAGDDDVYSLLSAIGRDCAGALQFLPVGTDPGPAGNIEAEPVDDETIAEILGALETAPLGLGEDDAFRISLAGAQEKTALLYWKESWWRPRGTTPTTHILKPQIGQRGAGDLSRSVENEYLCMQTLKAMELPVAETRIVDFGQQRALVVDRFDRQWTRDGRLLRVPQEDCCQALSVPSALKYESDGGPGIVSILELLKASDDPAGDQALFLKVQIAFWLLGAADGHAKNFSLFLHPGGGFRLTPVYDVMSTQPLLDLNQIRRNQMRMSMAVGRRRHYRLHEVMPRHFQQSAALAGVSASVVEQIFDEITEKMPTTIDGLPNAELQHLPMDLVESVFGGIRRRLTLIETMFPRIRAP